MSFGGTPNTDLPEKEKLAVEDEQYSSAQEAVPVPMFAGTRKVALRWISRVYNQRAKEAPAERPDKK